MKIRTLLGYTGVLLGMILLVLPPCQAALSDRSLMIVDFEEDDILGKIIPNEGVKISLCDQDAVSGKRSLEVQVGRFSEHANRWPSITLGPKFFTTPADFSRYSRMALTIRNVSEGMATPVVSISSLPFNDSGSNLEYKGFLIPAGTSMVCNISMSGLRRPMNEPSTIALLIITFPARETEAVYRIDAIQAIYDSAEGSPAEQLLRDAQLANKQVKRVSEQVNWQAVPAEKRKELQENLSNLTQEAQTLVREAQQSQTQGFAGRYQPLKNKLDTVSHRIGQYLLADKQGFYAWRTAGYKFVFRDDFPALDSTPVEKLDMSMALNEFRHLAFMVSACEKDVQLTVEVELPQTMPPDALVAQCTDFYEYQGRDHGDGLIAAAEAIEIPQGQAREIWLRFDTRWNDLPPGEYAYAVKLRDLVGGAEQTIPGNLTVWDFRLVPYDVLPNNTWAQFFNSEIEPGAVQDHAVRHMKMYGLNMMWFLSAEMPWPVEVNDQLEIVNFNGSYLREKIHSIAQAWKLAKGSDRLWWAFAIDEPWKHLLAGDQVKYPSQEWKKVFIQWIEGLRQVFREEGLAEQDWMFILNDESSESVLLTEEIPLAEILKGHDPHIQLACNTSTIISDAAKAQRFFQLFDYLQPNLDALENHPDLLKWLRQSGKPLWTYRCECTIEPSLNLYEYFRVYGWKLYKYGLVGRGLWTYCAQGRSPWGEPSVRAQRAKEYNLVFKHKEKNDVIHSRRYEYYREGQDDYRYLLTLKEYARQNGLPTEQRIEQLIGQALEDILSDVTDRSRCEKWRIRIAQEILQLKSGIVPVP